MKRKGTKEWSKHSKNIDIGCPNNCRHCYARHQAERRNLVEEGEWPDPHRNKYSQLEMKNDKFEKLDGRIMFPTTHDLHEGNVDVAIRYMKGWLEAGNDMLIVSKPRYNVMRQVTDELQDYKDQIVFRFTIGSKQDGKLEYWDRNAPGYMERFASLICAHSHGYETSVSIEPILGDCVDDLIAEVGDYVTDTIWIGTMNKKDERVKKDPDDPEWDWFDQFYHHMIEVISGEEYLQSLYERQYDNDKIRWKDSIQEKLNLESEEG